MKSGDNGRSFYGDGPITTSYGNVVEVYPSSAATRACVWLSVSVSPHLRQPIAHMDLEQATAVRDALTEFIDSESKEEAEPSFLPCNSTRFCVSHGYCWRCNKTKYIGCWGQNGVSTPGCDCAHEDMGAQWHANNCAWIIAQQTRPDEVFRERCGAEIVKALESLTPGLTLGRIWGRRSGTSHQDGWESNLWAMDPKDLAELVMKVLDPLIRPEDK
jgi:hypothetical protein